MKDVSIILFDDIGKSISFNYILDFAILSDFKIKNVIIWHCQKMQTKYSVKQRTRLCISLAYSEASLICVCLCSIHNFD